MALFNAAAGTISQIARGAVSALAEVRERGHARRVLLDQVLDQFLENRS